MAINFPNTPIVGQLYTFNNTTWEWTSQYWRVYSAQTGYVTTVSNSGLGSSIINSLLSNTLTLKTFSGSSVTITDTGTQLNFSVNNYDAGVILNSSGWSNNGNGTMNLPQVQVALYNNPNFLGEIRVYTVPSGVTGSGGISSLTDNDTNYIYIEYNNGSPRWVVSTDNSAINGSTVVRFQNVYRIGNFIHNLEWGNEGAGLPNKIANRIDAVDRFARESGLSLGLSGSTGVVTLSAGVAWNGTLRQSLASVNSQDDIFFQNFHSGGTWVISTTADTLNNLYYDNGTNRVLASGGTYLVNWYYRGQEINDHLYEVWGNTGYTTVSEARLSAEPSLPELITSHAFLLGRIIVQKGSLNGIVETAFTQIFQPTTVQEHNDLTGLQGGTSGEYYHLTSNQVNNLALTNTSNNFTTQQTFSGGLNSTVLSGGTFYGDGSNLIGVPKYYKEPSIPPTISPLVIGTDSIAIGNGAKTSGDNQLSFGTEAGQLSISGEASNFIGWGAGYNSTGVTYSNLIGYFVGERVKNVEISNIIGEGAGIDGNNIYASNLYGTAAGTNATNIFYSNLIGNESGLDSNDIYHTNFIGSSAGKNSSSSLSNFIGHKAGQNFSGGNNNIIIGNNISLPNNVSNSINIGGVLFGADTYSTSGGTPSVVPTTQGKIGIGIVTPLNRLHVEDTSNPVRFVGLQSGNTDTRILTSDSNGVIRYRNFSDFSGGTGGGSGLSGDYLPLSGGTVTGSTTFTNGLISNTISATTISGDTFYGDGRNLIGVPRWYAESDIQPTVYPYEKPYVITGNTGQGSFALGPNAQSLSFDQISFGDLAGRETTGASRSNFIGYGSGIRANDSDLSNFIGQSAGSDSKNSNNSNFIGTGAGQNSKNAGFSNFIGHNAGYNISGETIVGFDREIKGFDSNFIGNFAGSGAIYASGSTFIGTNAGSNATNSYFSNFIGYLAGKNAINASYSTLIGYNVGTPRFGFNQIGKNNIIIGNSITLPNGATDSINIGGVLFGINTNFDTSGGSPSDSPTSTGKIGIGVVTPLNRLHVEDTSDPLRLVGLQTLNTDTEVLTTDTNGVIHKRPYDYVTGLTYNNQNILRVNTTVGSYSATINQMTGLTVTGDLTVTGNYIVSGDTIISGNTLFSGTTTLQSVPNAIGDFLTLPSNKIVSKRTSDQVRDDIGYYGLTFAIINGYF